MTSTLLSRIESLLKVVNGDEDKDQEVPTLYVELVLKLMEIVEDRNAINEAIKTSATKRPKSSSSSSSLIGCLPPQKSKKSTSLIGSGYFGDVFVLGNTGRVAKLMGFVHPDAWMRRPLKKTHAIWRTEVEMATLAGEHGIGPKVYDSYICLQASQPIGVIVMDYIEGVTLAEWRKQGPTKKQEAQADAIVLKKVAALHELGVFHGDLHADNVMVVTSGTKKKLPKDVVDAFIVDYGYAKSKTQLAISNHDDLKYLVDGRMPRRDKELVAKQIVAILLKDGSLPPMW